VCVHELLEARLIEEYNRAVVATVTSGLAHHFNNVMSGVLGLVSLAPSMDSASLATLSERLKTQIEHACRLIRVVLTITRYADDEQLVESCEAVSRTRDAVALMRTTTSATTTIEETLPSSDLWVGLSPVAFNRLLLVSLSDAIARVGHQGQGRIRIELAQQGGGASLGVTGNAPTVRGAPYGSSLCELLAAGGTLDTSALTHAALRALAAEAGGTVSFDPAQYGIVIRLPGI
jgi:hypothetical protein